MEIDRSSWYGKFIIRGGDPSVQRDRAKVCAVCRAPARAVEEAPAPIARVLTSGRVRRDRTVTRTYYCDEHGRAS